MKGDKNLKEFFIEVLDTMEREDTTLLDMTLTFDETKVTFQINVAKVEKPDGTTVEFYHPPRPEGKDGG